MDKGTRIAGERTASDWQVAVGKLDVEVESGWGDLFDDYFVTRIQTRYFCPLKAIEELSENNGEGFSAVAILCLLIEFLEAMRFGISYRHKANVTFEKAKKDGGDYIYGDGNAQKIICSFLLNACGNCQALCATEDDAKSFYRNVRCAVLHDARTTEGWVIWRNSGTIPIEIAGELRAVNWMPLRDYLERVVCELKQSVINHPESRKAFKRKFDALCA